MKCLGNLLLAALVFGIVPSFSYSQTKSGGSSIGGLKGDCRVLLNGTDIGCTNGAVHTSLQNGRHLVSFAAQDVATVGFAGQKLQTTGSSSSILWVDGVYINQERYPADGQCSFEHSTTGMANLKCSAVLRDGRKLAALINGSEQREAFLGLKPSFNKSEECRKILELHGMLSRAQFQCNFSAYSNSMLDEAKRCGALLSQDETKKQVASGMEIFDYNEKRRGHDAMCQSILTNFPDFIRK